VENEIWRPQTGSGKALYRCTSDNLSFDQSIIRIFYSGLYVTELLQSHYSEAIKQFKIGNNVKIRLSKQMYFKSITMIRQSWWFSGRPRSLWTWTATTLQVRLPKTSITFCEVREFIWSRNWQTNVETNRKLNNYHIVRSYQSITIKSIETCT